MEAHLPMISRSFLNSEIEEIVNDFLTFARSNGLLPVVSEMQSWFENQYGYPLKITTMPYGESSNQSMQVMEVFFPDDASMVEFKLRHVT